jgi:hypothetical protein
MGNLLELVREYEKLNDQIINQLYPIIHKMYDDKLLNKGHLPTRRTAKESITITEVSTDNENISVKIEIWWGGDCYDYGYLTFDSSGVAKV